MVDYFHRATVKALGTAYPVVSEPGPDVMRVRVALTQLVPTQTEMSVVTLLTPYAEIPDIASGAMSKGGWGSAPYLGDAAIEAMGLDGATGELLLLIINRFVYLHTKPPCPERAPARHENPPPAPLFLRGVLKSPFDKGGFRGI